MVAAVVDDLLFRSKIRAVADRAGQVVTFVHAGPEMVANVREASATLVIVDLGDPRAIETIQGLKAASDLAHVPIVAFVSHVRADLITAAREAGADTVLARSAFVTQLPALLAPGDARP
jgi:CheY-like chemotaxis protein